MKRYIILIIVYTGLLTFFAYNITHSFFTAVSSSLSNTYTASANFPTATLIPSILQDIVPTPTPTIGPTPTGIQATNHIVISEVQIDGGSGSDNDNDFIELYNPTSSPITLNGFRLVKRSGGSGSDSNVFAFTASHSIPAHGYFLWAHQSGGQNPNTFATTIGADVSSAETLGATNSVALRQGALNTGPIVDALSWDPGASSLKEGTQFPSNPQENQGLERKAFSSSTSSSMSSSGSDEFRGNGYDTDDNTSNFIIRSLSQPQKSSSPVETP